MANIKVILAYDGTNYHGFQEQRGTGFMTVQSVFEERLSKLAKRDIRVIGAGRTDAGVHARGQVVNFESGDLRIPPERLTYALNSLLPMDIVALEASEVPAAFHSRFSAIAKTYQYVINNGKNPSPFLRLYSYHIPRLLNTEAMQDGAQHLVGRHDFSAFRALGTPVKTTVRNLYGIRVSREGDLVYIEIRADGFLYHMARMIAGTLIRLGLGKIEPQDVSDIQASCDSLKGGPAAPARGLFLDSIEYPDTASDC
jgi:tRNA pseudouridine38-40 synthase